MRYEAILIACLLFGCASEEALDVAGPPAVGSTGGAAGAGGGLNLGGSVNVPDGGGGDAGESCVAQTLEATLEKRPLDFVILIDSSPSMGSAVSAIAKTFDQSFATTMDASGVDYRVIMIAPKPFVTNPADPSRYFHYPRSNGSGDIPQAFLSTFKNPPGAGKLPAAGWSEWARPDAKKALLAITDAGSGPTMGAPTFENQLYNVLKLPGWGTPEKRNYSFHFMAGFKPNTPASEPWLPDDPIINAQHCAAVGALGQGLSRLTGGLRFSYCVYAQYPSMFQALSQSEVDQTPVACDFAIPDAPAGKTIDTDTIEIEYSGGATFSQLHDEAECDDAGGFYVDGSELHLCPSTCAEIQADPTAKLDVSYGCPTGFIP
jgi:hypothetical protein